MGRVQGEVPTYVPGCLLEVACEALAMLVAPAKVALCAVMPRLRRLSVPEASANA